MVLYFSGIEKPDGPTSHSWTFWRFWFQIWSNLFIYTYLLWCSTTMVFVHVYTLSGMAKLACHGGIRVILFWHFQMGLCKRAVFWHHPRGGANGWSCKRCTHCKLHPKYVCQSSQTNVGWNMFKSSWNHQPIHTYHSWDNRLKQVIDQHTIK